MLLIYSGSFISCFIFTGQQIMGQQIMNQQMNMAAFSAQQREDLMRALNERFAQEHQEKLGLQELQQDGGATAFQR